ncbi:MAG: type II secretion system protein [Vampirovibrionales bacterium]
MLPCLQYNTNKTGFTLSELLISLAVLGLISALTLPSIFNSVSTAQMKAKQKETIQILQDVVYQGFMNGDFQNISSWGFQNTTDPSVQYFTSKLAGSTHCPKGITTPPCTHNRANSGLSHSHNNHSGRWVLPNGVGVWIWDFSSSRIGWFIDGNMSNTTSTFHVAGADQLAIFCNFNSTNQTWVTNVPAKLGQCTASSNLTQLTFSALYQ